MCPFPPLDPSKFREFIGSRKPSPTSATKSVQNATNRGLESHITRGLRLRLPHFLRERVGHPFYAIVQGDDRRRPNVVLFSLSQLLDTACRKDGTMSAQGRFRDLALISSLCRANCAAVTPDPGDAEHPYAQIRNSKIIARRCWQEAEHEIMTLSVRSRKRALVLVPGTVYYLILRAGNVVREPRVRLIVRGLLERPYSGFLYCFHDIFIALSMTGIDP